MLHIIYRSYGGENRKGRPEYYSKTRALFSFLRAFERLDGHQAEVIFLNDGPIASNIVRMMEGAGEIVQRSHLGNIGSLHRAFKMPQERGWLANDLVWLSEDDYLYSDRSFVSLAAATEAFPEADYFSLYALIGDRQPNGAPSTDERIPAAWKEDQVRVIGGIPWRRALSTTSTFGARVRTISADRNMMSLAMRCGGAFDHTTCLAYQGFTPFPADYLASSLREQITFTTWTRAFLIAMVRLAFNGYVAARKLKTPPRLLVASDPSLATHMETAFIAQGSDWVGIAADTDSWMEAKRSAIGIQPPIATPVPSSSKA